MKKRKSLFSALSVILAAAIVAGTTMIAGAADSDTGIIAQAAGSQYTGGRDEGTPNGDYLEFEGGRGESREFMCPDLTGLTEGTVYKAALYLTVSEIAEPGWTVKVRPQGDYYFLTSNENLVDPLEDFPQQVIVVVPFKATGTTAKVNTVLEGFTGSIDKVVIADKDYNFMADQDGYVLTNEYGYHELIGAEGYPRYEGGQLDAGDPGAAGEGWTPSSEVVAPPVDKSSAKEITSFKLGDTAGVITGDKIAVELPKGTDLTNLAATAVISAKATIDPAPETVKDYTDPVTFTVTAEDGSKATYTVTATVKTEDEKGKPAVAAEKYLVNEKEVSIGYDSKDGVVEVLAWNNLSGVNIENGSGATKDESGDFVIIPKTNNGRAFWNFTTRAQDGANYNNGLVTVYKVRVADEENALKDLSDDTVLFHFDNNYNVGDFPVNFTKADYLKAPKDADGFGSFVVKMDKETLKVIKPDFEGEFTFVEGRFGGNGVVELNVSKEMTHYVIDNEEGMPLYDVQNPDSLAVGGTEPGKVDTSKLTDAIAKATELFNTAKVGTNAGQYPQSAKDALDTAIKAAKAVADNKDADQKAVDDAVTALNTAVETFKAAVVKADDPKDPDPVDPTDPVNPVDPTDPDPEDPSTPGGNNPVTGAAGIAVGTLVLAAAAGATMFLTKKRK